MRTRAVIRYVGEIALKSANLRHQYRVFEDYNTFVFAACGTEQKEYHAGTSSLNNNYYKNKRTLYNNYDVCLVIH